MLLGQKGVGWSQGQGESTWNHTPLVPAASSVGILSLPSTIPCTKAQQCGRECLGEHFQEKWGADGFVDTASWQPLQGLGKSRRKMRVSELPSDCPGQHWLINCGYTVLRDNWLYPLHSVSEKWEEKMEEVLQRMSVIWEWPVESFLVLTEFDMLKLMICKIFAKGGKGHVLQLEDTASSLETSFITCMSSNFLLIHFSSSIIF